MRAAEGARATRFSGRGLWLRALLLGLPLALLGFVLLLGALNWLVRPDLSRVPEPRPAAEVELAERARDVSFDASRPEALPRIEKPVDYTLGPAAPWWPKGESPLLAELVQAGQLPPVAERVGPQPLVLDGGSIGKYGGTWLRAATSPWDVFIIEFRIGYPTFFRWSPLGYPIVPHLGLSVDAAPDQKSFVVHLRPGVRWSDGHPFGADDVLFWWERWEIDTTLGDGVPPSWLTSGKGQTRVTKIDDLTFQVAFDEPFGNFMEVLASYGHFMLRYPKHHLQKYHPATADPEFLAREMQAFGLSSAFSLWEKVWRFDNPECPRLWPWVPRTYSDNPPYVYVRNPYYYAVDPEGNQLPYIDRVQFEVKNAQMLPLSFTSGEVTMQGRHVSYDNYTELMSRQAEGKYRLLHWYPATRSSWVINPNQNRWVDPEQPATANKARLLADKRFRQALSLAIDRDAIIRARYDGQVRPAQVEPGPASPFHHPGLASAYIEHDPARANALLDELGLRGRDIDGMRTFPDGSLMTFYLTFAAFPGLGPGEFVVDDWRKVGVRVIAREQGRMLFQNKRDSADFDFMVWTSESDFFPLLSPRSFVPPDIDALYATSWGRWFTRGGLYGAASASLARNAYGPATDHPMYASYLALVEARQKPSVGEQVSRFKEALDIAAENLWTINVAEAPPFLVVVDRDLRNVPPRALNAAAVNTPGNAGLETYYFEHPSHVADLATRSALEQVTPMTRAHAPEAAAHAGGVPAGQSMARLIRWCLAGILLGFLILIGARHPFVARRLLILVPTLLVVSVVVFVVIELPVGDYLSARLLLYSETGDGNALQQTEELRKIFHFDDPVWRRYLSWLGVPWFWTFDAADLGLLQGFLGRSMETSRPVNDIVGDRILLTVVISLATILFTWAVAIPIGVYSAVRQYSVGDYLFTFIGFLGMSVPPFLLALLLMLLAGVSGLFSPEYAAQPAWSWGKVVDLLKHVWIPVVVMGVSGTASLARVMRANLLDELKKPYVMTARARGVRPLRLLFKYPVRVALNPFVSGIGQLFPQLVSGGAIVGIVLSLPILGPLQIEALLMEDTYLAGSMLMVLSLLSVFGTLVADLLLLWLDPRIRYDQGAR
jgi:ABC-type dipeptide/oligopeptide/nickel transport system permease component/ABC-type transport system substrate-binding protein